MDSVPGTPGPQTRTAVTQRIIAHVTRGWPHLGEPIVRHRGRYCYISALLPGYREPAPILRLRYQGSAGRWASGIYLASSGRARGGHSRLSWLHGPDRQSVDTCAFSVVRIGSRTGVMANR